ncbi:hypothetical protein [Methylocapsa palsarum]|uniref:Uncharacterized protein n=1 Tax=Methylocapsa palsarum TaxID=1612308 RepID=A0A1I3Z8H7_9HYPH|nr:hypothetical protein [Methylocapsa palsarum]SFK40190.1 hypothetical protein SAMN05444581_107142 [Methylocapsa palsarum]
MRKMACYCDRCAIAADWRLQPSKHNARFFELSVSCHGETERFMVAAASLVHARDPATGREIGAPLFVIAFEGEKPRLDVKLIEPAPQSLSIRLSNPTNRLVGE